MPAAPALQATGLVKHYDGRKVLDQIDLTVASGETVAVTGANGSGKSTLLRVLAAVARPDAGALHLQGIDARKAPDEARRHLALVAQDPPLYDELTAAEHLHWWTRLTGRRADAQALLAEAGLATVAHRRAGTLSRGQRQRLALALAFAGDPPILLLDEPFTALDADGQAWLTARLAARRGRQTTILALHGDEHAHRVADRVVQLAHRHAKVVA